MADSGSSHEPSWAIVEGLAYGLAPPGAYGTERARRGLAHLEARYNYEDLDTGSAWMGVNDSRRCSAVCSARPPALMGFSVNRATFTAYVFNPDEDNPRFVFGAEWTF